ncbi:MAG: hypothetical protein COS90_10430 [Deltaproteobacteria bacterium CG07_land_8_20_14_0_80_60_11]|nr:MAG: hypothetical protein COS90_10430 [Deltaproteobacteria bacterium CG07_land_8_20_14_0_80_60_11]
MRRRHVLGFGLAALLVAALIWPPAALSQGRGQGFRPCPYTPYQCPVTGVCKPMTITGKVSQVLTETLQDKMHPGMAILVDSKDKGRVRVHLGPVWYLERQEFDLEPGQEVQVKGICLEEKGETRLIAAQVTVGDSVLLLRDQEGRPMWEAWRKR